MRVFPSKIIATSLAPFGMVMKERSWEATSTDKYGFGYQGQEEENNISGNNGDHIVFDYRIHDVRLGRFMSIDPLFKDYPWNSPYAFAENDVIRCKDLEGAEKAIAIISSDDKGNTQITVFTDKETIKAMWLSFSMATSLGDKKIIWDNNNKASVYNDASSSRYKWYEEGSKTSTVYPNALEDAGILTIDTRGKDAVLSYYDWSIDYNHKVQAVENKTNEQTLDLLDKTLTVASLFIGIGELRTAWKAGQTMNIFINGASVAATVDELTKASSKIKNEAIKSAIENIKLAIGIYNINSGINKLQKIEDPLEGTKVVANAVSDAKTVVTTLKEDVKRLNAEIEKCD